MSLLENCLGWTACKLRCISVPTSLPRCVCSIALPQLCNSTLRPPSTGCSHVRGFLARRHLQQQHAAATTIQHAVRGFQERKRAAAVAALKQQMAEMARLMQQYAARTAAALRIQVWEQLNEPTDVARACC